SPLAWGVIFWEPKSMGSLRLVGWGFVVCSCVAAVYVQSRQAAGIFVLSVFLFFFLWRPLWGIVVGIVALMLMLSIDILLGGGLINKIQLFPRTYIWKAAWEMFLDNPVWGQGPGLFRHHYYEYLERAG